MGSHQFLGTSLKIAATLLVFALFFIVAHETFAAPYNGRETDIIQPDGSRIKARIFGDEFYARYESPDGYSLVKDSVSGWYYYATLSSNKKKLIPTGIRYKSPKDDAGVTKSVEQYPLEKHLVENIDEVRKFVEKSKKEFGFRERKIRTLTEIHSMASATAGANPAADGSKAATALTGNVIGLTLLVSFPPDLGKIPPDDPGETYNGKATVPVSEFDAFFNQASGYTGYGNYGSVRQYYADVSGGLMIYTNRITAYYMAKNPKSYYTDRYQLFTVRATELIKEGLDYLAANGYDFSSLSVDPLYRSVLAINCLYAGTRDNNWKEGLWPHKSRLYNYVVGKYIFDAYQITEIGSNLSIGVVCHENGHMVMEFPDLYDYTYASAGAGVFCLMSGGVFDNKPVPPCAPLRYLAGWDTPFDLTMSNSNVTYSVTSDGHSPYLFSNLAKTTDYYESEWFMIESRTQNGWNGNLPAAGMLIWHVDESGDNTQGYSSTDPCGRHYRISLEQADGRMDLEQNANSGEASDVYSSATASSFTDYTNPNANWWCPNFEGEKNSKISISSISAAGDIMTFEFGTSLTNLACAHPTTLVQDPSQFQDITVTTNVDELQVQISSTSTDPVGTKVATTNGGNATFYSNSVPRPGVINVMVYGKSYRYKGSISVISTPWATHGLRFSRAGQTLAMFDAIGHLQLLRHPTIDYPTAAGLVFSQGGVPQIVLDNFGYWRNPDFFAEAETVTREAGNLVLCAAGTPVYRLDPVPGPQRREYLKGWVWHGPR